MTSAPPPRSSVGTDRPLFAAWVATAVVAVDLVAFLAGPPPLGRGAVVATLHLALMSVITFALFGWDKARAARTGRRVSEFNLLALSLLGGAFGGYAGFRLFRHKTQKTAFKVGLPLAMLVSVVVVGWFWVAS